MEVRLSFKRLTGLKRRVRGARSGRRMSTIGVPTHLRPLFRFTKIVQTLSIRQIRSARSDDHSLFELRYRAENCRISTAVGGEFMNGLALAHERALREHLSPDRSA